jgi:hypothetical protein
LFICWSETSYLVGKITGHVLLKFYA